MHEMYSRKVNLPNDLGTVSLAKRAKYMGLQGVSLDDRQQCHSG